MFLAEGEGYFGLFACQHHDKSQLHDDVAHDAWDGCSIALSVKIQASKTDNSSVLSALNRPNIFRKTGFK